MKSIFHQKIIFQISVNIHLSRSKFIIEFEFDHYKMTKQIFSELLPLKQEWVPFKQEWVIHIGIKYLEKYIQVLSHFSLPLSIFYDKYANTNHTPSYTLQPAVFSMI